jgi:hypothetical protein
VTQPNFVPVPDSAIVRATMTTATPEIGRAKKAGLLGGPNHGSGVGRGTATPDAGYALTLTHEYLHQHHIVDTAEVNHHDLEVGMAALASKRAGLFGRGPSMSDVRFAFELAGITNGTGVVSTSFATKLRGVGHSYFLLRDFVDGVDVDLLRGTVAEAPTASH